jgi:hypothetical protein
MFRPHLTDVRKPTEETEITRKLASTLFFVRKIGADGRSRERRFFADDKNPLRPCFGSLVGLIKSKGIKQLNFGNMSALRRCKLNRVQEASMPRFQIGEGVHIRCAVTARHYENEAIVVAVEISQHSRPGVTSLDKYIVRFSNGEQAEFYDIHLASGVTARQRATE